MNPYLVKIIFQPAVRSAVSCSLIGRNRDRQDMTKGRFTRTEVNTILKDVWQDYDQLAPQAPREPKSGNQMNVYLACMTFACLQVLISAGVERRYAIELIGDIAWHVYERWGRIAGFIAGLYTGDIRQKLRLSVNMFLRFPFNPPGYLFKRIPNQNGISFDMLRCPVAEYFQSQGASDLCLATWCNLDFPLAEIWGGRLERLETLSAGSSRCDFRFIAGN